MLKFCLFAPLAPTVSYSSSIFEFTFDKRRYDLPIPVVVGEALVAAITSPDLGFFRSDDYSDSERQIDLLRDHPARLARESNGTPAYAEIELCFDLLSVEGEPDRGYETRRVIVSAKLTDCLLALLYGGDFFDERVGEHLLRRDAFLRESGGFELLSAMYYFDDIDRHQVRRAVAKTRPEAVTEQRGRKLRFRDVMNCAITS